MPTKAEIEAAKTPAGAWTRETLASWGVPWPPPKGWRQALLSTSSVSPQEISRAEFLCHHGWTETPEGWLMQGGFCKPLQLDDAFKMHAIIDELDSPAQEGEV